MRIAVLSDIHGEFGKLKMILDQIQGADKLVLLGDLYVGGDFPSACWTLLKTLKIDIQVLRNTDEWLLESFDISSLDMHGRQEVLAAKAKLNASVMASLRAADNEKKWRIGKCNIFCIHDFMITKNLSLALIEQRMHDYPADLILCGHTHQPMMLQSKDKILLNPGAVNQGCYALIEIGERVENVSLRRL